jgi:hypothetical protein
MRERVAINIFKSLVQGVDPATGDELPSPSVLSQTDVLRALLLATAALEQQAQRQQRRSRRPPNSGRVWAPDEEASLIASFRSGDALVEIAKKHGRGLPAIERRLERLGVLTSKE